MPENWRDAYGLLWYLHEREYGTNSRAKDREQRRADAQKLEQYKRSVARLKAQGRVE